MDEGLHSDFAAGVQQCDAARQVGGPHALEVRLGGVGAIGCQVEHPIGLDFAHDAADCLPVFEIRLVEAHIGRQLVESPGLTRRAHEEMDFVTIAPDAAGQVGAYKTGCSGDEHSFHGSS